MSRSTSWLVIFRRLLTSLFLLLIVFLHLAQYFPMCSSLTPQTEQEVEYPRAFILAISFSSFSRLFFSCLSAISLSFALDLSKASFSDFSLFSFASQNRHVCGLCVALSYRIVFSLPHIVQRNTIKLSALTYPLTYSNDGANSRSFDFACSNLFASSSFLSCLVFWFSVLGIPALFLISRIVLGQTS